MFNVGDTVRLTTALGGQEVGTLAKITGPADFEFDFMLDITGTLGLPLDVFEKEIELVNTTVNA